MAFDMSQVQRGARNRRTPYHEAAQKHDPKGYTVYNHMYFPIRFDSFEAEFDALLNGVTLVGRRGRALPRDRRPRRVPVRPAAHAARPVEVRRRPGQVRPDLRQRRRHHQRPGHDADGREHVLVRARVLGRAAVRARAEERLPGPRRDDPARRTSRRCRSRGRSRRTSMAKLVGREILDLRYYFWTESKIAGAPVVITRTGLDAPRSATRCTSPTRRKGVEVYEAIMEAGAGVRHQSDGPERHPADRGRDLQLGRRHDLREQPDRAGSRPPGRLGPRRTTPASRWRRYRAIQERGVEPPDQRRRDRRRPVPELNNAEVADRSTGRAEIGKVTSAIYSPRLERNIGFCVAPGRALDARASASPSRPSGVQDGDRGRDAVRRPEQADPGLLGTVGPNLKRRSAGRARPGPAWRLAAGRGLNDDSKSRRRPADGSEGSCPDGERTAGDARAERDALLRTLVPAIPVLRRDAAGRLHRLRRLQPHAPARVLRRPRGRVLGAAERRHGVGRRRSSARSRSRGRTRIARSTRAHVPRPHDVRGEAGQVHDRDRAGRRDRQRPGPAARRREPLVDAARGLGRRPLRARRRVAVEPRRRGVVPARVPDAGPGRAGGEDAREARRPRRCSTSSTTGATGSTSATSRC